MDLQGWYVLWVALVLFFFSLGSASRTELARNHERTQAIPVFPWVPAK